MASLGHLPSLVSTGTLEQRFQSLPQLRMLVATAQNADDLEVASSALSTCFADFACMRSCAWETLEVETFYELLLCCNALLDAADEEGGGGDGGGGGGYASLFARPSCLVATRAFLIHVLDSDQLLPVVKLVSTLAAQRCPLTILRSLILHDLLAPGGAWENLPADARHRLLAIVVAAAAALPTREDAAAALMLVPALQALARVPRLAPADASGGEGAEEDWSSGGSGAGGERRPSMRLGAPMTPAAAAGGAPSASPSEDFTRELAIRGLVAILSRCLGLVSLELPPPPPPPELRSAMEAAAATAAVRDAPPRAAVAATDFAAALPAAVASAPVAAASDALASGTAAGIFAAAAASLPSAGSPPTDSAALAAATGASAAAAAANGTCDAMPPSLPSSRAAPSDADPQGSIAPLLAASAELLPQQQLLPASPPSAAAAASAATSSLLAARPRSLAPSPPPPWPVRAVRHLVRDCRLARFCIRALLAATRTLPTAAYPPAAAAVHVRAAAALSASSAAAGSGESGAGGRAAGGGGAAAPESPAPPLRATASAGSASSQPHSTRGRALRGAAPLPLSLTALRALVGALTRTLAFCRAEALQPLYGEADAAERGAGAALSAPNSCAVSPPPPPPSSPPPPLPRFAFISDGELAALRDVVVRLLAAAPLGVYASAAEEEEASELAGDCCLLLLVHGLV